MLTYFKRYKINGLLNDQDKISSKKDEFNKIKIFSSIFLVV